MIKIKVNDKIELRAEENVDKQYKEIIIGLYKDNSWYQDLAIIRPKYTYDENDEVINDPENYEILVFGNACDEDYTNKFSVELYDER